MLVNFSNNIVFCLFVQESIRDKTVSSVSQVESGSSWNHVVKNLGGLRPLQFARYPNVSFSCKNLSCFTIRVFLKFIKESNLHRSSIPNVQSVLFKLVSYTLEITGVSLILHKSLRMNKLCKIIPQLDILFVRCF